MLNRLTDVLRSLKEHDVQYVVIGGIAAVLHGVPRATFDLDILIESTPDNAQRKRERKRGRSIFPSKLAPDVKSGGGMLKQPAVLLNDNLKYP